MKNGLEKILQGFVSGVLLFAPVFNSNAIANTRKPGIRAKQIITEFLSSVELGKDVYDFDHNGDGIIDMFVYPLKTKNPDNTEYTTLKEAVNKKQIVLKENPRISPSRNNSQGRYPIVVQYPGYSGISLSRNNSQGSYAMFAQYPGYRPRYDDRSIYYQRGGILGGGYQSRGFGRGGILEGYSYRNYARHSKYESYTVADFRDDDFWGEDFRDTGFKKAVAMIEFSSNFNSLDVEVDALCFEKWRLIEESRLRGEPEYFSYVGMASPQIRKELISFPNQINIHIDIGRELRKLDVYSKTGALADVFKNRNIKEVIDYYIADSKKILGNGSISGIIVTNKNKILCADVYSSPSLFKKMLPQLMQSAALGVLREDRKGIRYLEETDIKKFLYELKQNKKMKKEIAQTTLQTYRLLYLKIISGVELYSDENGMKVIHLEAYPR